MNPSQSLAHSLYKPSPYWSTRMRSARFLLPKDWSDWLLNTSSLSARLQASKSGEYWVQVLYEGYSKAFVPERRWVKNANQIFWCREVCLYLGSTPVVYARTLIPSSVANPQLYMIRHLANKPLGEYLFSQPELQRGEISINSCPDNELGVRFCRCSSFTLAKQKIFIAEAFCEALLELAH